jgi:hypothetical protein
MKYLPSCLQLNINIIIKAIIDIIDIIRMISTIITTSCNTTESDKRKMRE